MVTPVLRKQIGENDGGAILDGSRRRGQREEE
jgi:hypothetical protein